MSDEPIKAAEQRGYAKGYTAGQKRADREERERDAREQREAFRRAVFLAALPSYLNGSWTRGEEKMTTTAQRVSLAWRCADEAMKRV
jgi:hypothetical protein